MTATFADAIQADGEFPPNLAQWTGEAGLIRLVETITQVTWATGPSPQGTVTASASDARLLRVLAGCYAGGIFAAEDIEWAAATKPLVQMLSGGRPLSPMALQRFRRTHRQLLEICLGRLLYAAWQTRRFALRSAEIGAAEPDAVSLAAAAAEARRRIDVAMQFDLAFSE
jgi:hypothetical protein